MASATPAHTACRRTPDTCGNYRTQYKRTIDLNTIEATCKGTARVGINTNYGDSATLRNITVVGDTSRKIVPCQKYIGNHTGKEPMTNGSGRTARTASTRRPTSRTSEHGALNDGRTKRGRSPSYGHRVTSAGCRHPARCSPTEAASSFW